MGLLAIFLQAFGRQVAYTIVPPTPSISCLFIDRNSLLDTATRLRFFEGPVAKAASGEPKRSSIDHDSVHDEP